MRIRRRVEEFERSIKKRGQHPLDGSDSSPWMLGAFRRGAQAIFFVAARRNGTARLYFELFYADDEGWVLRRRGNVDPLPGWPRPDFEVEQVLNEIHQCLPNVSR